jgi:hypothetical protein
MMKDGETAIVKRLADPGGMRSKSHAGFCRAYQ